MEIPRDTDVELFHIVKYYIQRAEREAMLVEVVKSALEELTDIEGRNEKITEAFHKACYEWDV